MALANLKYVTKTLTNLLEFRFKAPGVWPDWENLDKIPDISAQPPDELKGDAVGLYLYHITEDNRHKNLPAPGRDHPPVRFTPMGLHLYYMLTTHCDGKNNEAAYKEHDMMGIALKALHDYPVINDSSEITIIEKDQLGQPQKKNKKILADGLESADNVFRVVLQPIPPQEAVNHWTAGTTGKTAQRLAAYYEVSVVLLEPEEHQSRASRVLDFGVHAFAGGAPRIDGSQNILAFTIPGQQGARELTFRPAQVPVDQRVLFTGSGFVAGATALLLHQERWDKPKEVSDPAWQVKITQSGVEAVVRETLSDGGPPVAIVPGIYAALARVRKTMLLPDGTERPVDYLSNACPFTISPRIDTFDLQPPESGVQGSAGDVIDVAGYLFADADIPPETVHVYFGEYKMARKDTPGLENGEFRVTGPTAMQLRLPDNLTTARHYPVRIFVNGAESPPTWIFYQ